MLRRDHHIEDRRVIDPVGHGARRGAEFVALVNEDRCIAAVERARDIERLAFKQVRRGHDVGQRPPVDGREFVAEFVFGLRGSVPACLGCLPGPCTKKPPCILPAVR